MKTIATLCVLASMLLALNGSTYFEHKASLFLSTDSTARSARIVIDQTDFDFKQIVQGVVVEHVFTVTNPGTDTLFISSVHTSCGCTAAFLDTMRVAPHGSTRLRIKFDSHGKAPGDIAKITTIKSNATGEPEVQVKIHGVILVRKGTHNGAMMHLDGIFEGDCASCHVTKGNDKFGAALYAADCAVCHGVKKDNKPAPTLTAEAMMNHTSTEWKKIIANGMAGRNMPAFHKKNKGPLDDEQIGSIVEYLAAVKENAKP